MIQLLIFRHAKAVRDDPGGDRGRALEGKGRKAAAFMGGWLRDRGFLPDFALVSDARRTRETFEAASAQFKTPVPVRFEPGMYNAGEDALLAVLRQADPRARRVLMIGHNPGLAEFAALLAGAGDRTALTRMRLRFPTGAIAVLNFEKNSWRDVGWSDARLESFVTPASLSGAPETD